MPGVGPRPTCRTNRPVMPERTSSSRQRAAPPARSGILGAPGFTQADIIRRSATLALRRFYSIHPANERRTPSRPSALLIGEMKPVAFYLDALDVRERAVSSTSNPLRPLRPLSGDLHVIVGVGHATRTTVGHCHRAAGKHRVESEFFSPNAGPEARKSCRVRVQSHLRRILLLSGHTASRSWC